MQNPFNFDSLRRGPRNYYGQNCTVSPCVSQNYGAVPDAVLFQNYGTPSFQYDFFTRQFQNELELKHHFNSLLNVAQLNDLSSNVKQSNGDYWGSANFERENRESENDNLNFCNGDSSEQWYSNDTRENQWSPTTHNTQQQQINGGSWVTFNNV